MEPNKLDQEFRDRLSKREMTPSPAAWDRLDAMLSVAEEKKSKPKFTWLYVAAGLLGFLLISSIFLNNRSNMEQGTEIIVESDTIRTNEATPMEAIPNSATPKTGIADTEHNNSSLEKSVKPTTNVPSSTKRPERMIASQEPVKVEVPPSADKRMPDATVEELLADVKLASVVNPTVKVDPNALLIEVDNELEQSFREKVIRSAGKNFQNVKVALANRNFN